MTDATRDKVQRTRRYLLESPLPEDTKDGLQTLLDAAANAANGTHDRVGAMADAILALSLHEVRQAVRAPGAIRAEVRAEVAQHVAQCPVGGGGKRGMVMAILLKPWPWVAAGVAAFSPHAPRILDAVRALAQ